MTAPSSNFKHDDLMSRWARFAARRKWYVLGLWLVLLISLVGPVVRIGPSYVQRATIPDTETQRAFDLLRSRFPARAGDTAQIVFRAPSGLTDPEARARVEAVLAEAATLPGVLGVTSPYDPGGRALSPDGTIGYATVQYDRLAHEIAPEDVAPLKDLVDRSGGDGLQVEVGGPVVQASEMSPPGKSEGIGLAAAIVILFVAFGSVIAVGLPVVTALFGLGSGLAALALASHFTSMMPETPAFASMIGLGVGIDYALLVVTRYREALAHGASVEDAVVEATGIAGRSVLFAGGAVVVALLSLLAIGIPFVAALGLAAAVTVGLAVLVAVTLLPALLAIAGRRIDRWRIPYLHADGTNVEGSVWFRLSRQVQSHPWWYLVGSAALLVFLALPVFSLRIGSSDAGNNPTSLHSRRAYDLLTEGFGPGFNGPLLVVADLSRGGTLEGAQALHAKVAATPGVAFVTPPIPNEEGDVALMMVYPAASPQAEETQNLVHTLRREVIPEAAGSSGMKAYVGGTTAAFIDIGERIGDRMPVLLAAVLGFSFLLLMMVFRSVLVPLKAALMNLLSIGAAYGVVVAVFQWGWFAGALGVKPGPIESFLPMMLFTILFGLSMDYEVFLISRVYEEYRSGRDNVEAVGRGLAVTARVITAAAAIMVTVFLSFMLDDSRVIKEFGLGLAAAIFVDATVVRLLLVPAAMALLGEANWWLPRWLDRVLPRLNIEVVPSARQGASPHKEEEAAAPSGGA